MDGSSITAGDSEGVIWLLDPQTGRPQANSPPGRFAVRGLAFNPDGRSIVSGGEREVVLWDSSSVASEHVLQTGESPIWSVAYSRDGRLVAAGGSDGSVRVFDLSNPGTSQSWTASNLAITSLSFSSDGRSLATLGCDDTLRLWDVGTRRMRYGFLSSSPQGISPNHWSEVMSVCYSPDGSQIATTGFDGIIRIWPAGGGVVQHEIRICQPGGRINQVEFTPDGRHLVTANGNGTIYVLRLADPS
jgi:WD40 repeat protein